MIFLFLAVDRHINNSLIFHAENGGGCQEAKPVMCIHVNFSYPNS